MKITEHGFQWIISMKCLHLVLSCYSFKFRSLRAGWMLKLPCTPTILPHGLHKVEFGIRISFGIYRHSPKWKHIACWCQILNDDGNWAVSQQELSFSDSVGPYHGRMLSPDISSVVSLGTFVSWGRRQGYCFQSPCNHYKMKRACLSSLKTKGPYNNICKTL